MIPIIAMVRVARLRKWMDEWRKTLVLMVLGLIWLWSLAFGLDQIVSGISA